MILVHFLPLGNGMKMGDFYLLDKCLAPDFTAKLFKVKLFSCGLSMPSCQHFLNLGAESAVVSFPLLRFLVLQCLLFRCRAGMCACKNTNVFDFFFLGRNVMSVVLSLPPAISGQPEIARLQFGPTERL